MKRQKKRREHFAFSLFAWYPRAMPTPPSTRVVSISTGTIIRAITVLLALVLVWLIRDIVLYIFTALLLAGVMYPFVRWAASFRIPKGLAVVIFYILMFGVF